MAEDVGTHRTQALVLLAYSDEWFARSIESVLTAGGYQVTKAATPDELLERARAERPDAIVLDVGLAEADGYGLCRALRRDPAVSLSTAIMLTTAGPVTRAVQLDALRAGAWELKGQPLDAEELLLRLGAYVQGKLEAERLGAAGLVELTSGLYNAAGIARRSQELAVLAARQGLALTCAVFSPADPLPDEPARHRLALAFKATGRVSDAIGRLGPTEFALFAPGIDTASAAQLVDRVSDRVARAFSEHQPNGPPLTLRAGYSAVATVPRGTFDPLGLLARARAKLA